MVKSRLLILAAAVLWSTAGAVMKSCDLSGWQIAGGRSLIAGIFLFLVLPKGRRLPNLPILLTSLAYAATVVLFALANKLTTAANAIFLQDTAPLWVLVFSFWLLGERPQRSALSSVPVFGLGLCLFFVDELSPGQLAGNLVALASGVAFAFCIVGLRRAHVARSGPVDTRSHEHAEPSSDGSASAASLIAGNALAALVTLPFWFSGPVPDSADLLILVYLGVFQLGLAYVCFARGMAHTSALEASLLALLEPVLNPIWTFLVVGERPGTWALAGAAIILVATVWRTLAPMLARKEVATLVLILVAVSACAEDDEGPSGAGGGASGAGLGGGTNSGVEALPDLVLDADYLIDTTVLDTVTIDDMCLLADGCVTGLGERKVVRFGTRTGNLGSGDLMLGAAQAGNPFWTHNTCRDSYDLVGFARYTLTDRATNAEVVTGAKNGFCIADADHYADGSGFCDVYDCENQGISVGCADNYGSELECQWVDITGVPPGAYELRVTLNADRSVPELDYENNVVRVQLDIGDSDLGVSR